MHGSILTPLPPSETPLQGYLSFDFVSAHMANPNANPMTDTMLLEFLVQVIGVEVRKCEMCGDYGGY